MINDPRVKEASGGGLCPVQWFGTLTNGWVFYYRMRHGWADVHVGPPGTSKDELPLINPNWIQEDFDQAYAQGEEYRHSFWAGPVASVNAYPGDPLIGYFESDEDLNRVFTECLDQIWDQME